MYRTRESVHLENVHIKTAIITTKQRGLYQYIYSPQVQEKSCRDINVVNVKSVKLYFISLHEGYVNSILNRI